MSATPYVSGPSNWFCNSGANGAWAYIGQAQGETRISLEPQWENIFVDGGGGSCPYDKSFMGAMGSVTGDLIRYDQTVINKLENWLNVPGSTPGVFPNYTLGSLARTESKNFSLAIVSTYASKQPYAAAGMVPAFVFPFAVPIGSWDVSRSTRVQVQRVAFECNVLWNLLGGGQLYTTDISGLDLPDLS